MLAILEARLQAHIDTKLLHEVVMTKKGYTKSQIEVAWNLKKCLYESAIKDYKECPSWP